MDTTIDDLLTLMAAQEAAQDDCIEDLLALMEAHTAAVERCLHLYHAKECTGLGCRCDIAEEYYRSLSNADLDRIAAGLGGEV